MDVRRLRLLLELSRLGSMRAVAETHGLTTSTVSQQVAALAREVGTALVEPDGRLVRLTPAGRRLADHAVTVLAAVDAARLDLDPDAEPAGTLRVAGFASGIRRALLPAIAALATSHPRVEVMLHEHEPEQSRALLLRDDLDLALTWDYNLAPASLPGELVATQLWSVPWGIGVPAGEPPAPFASYADRPWIANSRSTADEEVLRTLASLAGFTPRVVHRIDTLDLIDDLIADGHGLGLLPLDRTPRREVRVRPVDDPPVVLRAYAVVRRGREAWPPLRVLLERLAGSS